ncbi:unnamed protein product, partial [Lepidochelys olivacea]
MDTWRLEGTQRLNNSLSWFVARCATPNNHNGVEKQKILFEASKRDPPCNCKKSPTPRVVVALTVVSSALIAAIIALAEKSLQAFLLRHKGVQDHWIGLRREQGQPWKWTNGTKFNHLFHLRGGGDCAYLNDEKGVSSSRCYMGRRWICSKPE